jgi:hypothetical protein
MAQDEDNRNHHLSHIAGNAPGKAVGTKYGLITALLGGLHIVAYVDHRGNGRYHRGRVGVSGTPGSAPAVVMMV